MGYGFMAWAVDLDAVTKRIESKDQTLLEVASEETRAGMTALLSGDHGSVEAHELHYALQAVVDDMGVFLDNSALYPTGTQFPEVFDQALGEMGVTAISLGQLTFGTLPVSLPFVDDFPGDGSLDAEQVKQAKLQLDSAVYEGGDYSITEGLKNLRSWVEEASKLGWGIVGFFH